MSKDDQETAEDYKDDTVVPGEPAVVSNVFFFHAWFILEGVGDTTIIHFHSYYELLEC